MILGKSRFFAIRIGRLKKLETEVNSAKEKVETVLGNLKSANDSLEDSKKTLIAQLEEVSTNNSQDLKNKIKSEIIDVKRMECQKVLKTLSEEMSSSAKKKAQAILDRANSRYAPEFAWPKNTNLVENTDRSKIQLITDHGTSVLEELSEIAGIEITAISSPKEGDKPIAMKVAGGFGIHREAARRTLEELVMKGQGDWGNAGRIYKNNALKLDEQAKTLGKKAVNELRLEGIHPEIQYLIGALNWRTSYRQNQWYHTVEVAVLAGLIASEIGVDPDFAKRCGLLHDIGKAIDYRIEGSHAVISGDYADRYGEKKIICDTVMSHHADLLVETPLAYTLIAADTLSGARPGARINLEEGYQIRLSAIAEVVKSFQGINDFAIMNGGREVHISVNYRKVDEKQAQNLAGKVARKIEEDVAYPGQIKVLVSRSFENVTVA